MAKPIIRRKIETPNPAPVGAKFGRLLIISDGWEQVSSSGYRSDMVQVRCDCGKEKFVRPRSLTSATTLSCGCLHREQAKALCVGRMKHGHARRGITPKSRLYRVYYSMIARCSNPNTAKYSDYGGRGITVCERWRGEHGFEHFLEDMGNRPDGGSVERINNDGSYSPENCRWATASEQCNNRRSNRIIIHDGRAQTVSQWAREVGLKRATLNERLILGWSVSDALTTAVAASA